MGTPFITRLERPKIDGYDATLTHDKQPPHIPAGFIDSMSVREAVFVNEQGFPLEVELDKEDRRSCHWVIYASVKTIVEPEERDPVTNCVIRPRRSETKSSKQSPELFSSCFWAPLGPPSPLSGIIMA
jgi:hypothetical protein